MTNEETPALEFLPADLRKEIEAIAAEEGRDAAEVAAAGARLYLWDTTFRKLRRNAQQRARTQGIVSDEAVLTTVLALRRPDEYSLEKPSEPMVAADEAEDGVAEEEVIAPSSSRAEPRLHHPRGANGDASPKSDPTDGTRRRRTRGGRGRGERRLREVPAISADTVPAVTVEPAAVETMRRRAESVHRFLPPEPDSEAAASGDSTSAAERSPSPFTPPPSHRPEPPSQSVDFETAWPASPPRSPDERSRPPMPEPRPTHVPRAAEHRRPEPLASSPPEPAAVPQEAAASTYGRRPRRSGRR